MDMNAGNRPSLIIDTTGAPLQKDKVNVVGLDGAPIDDGIERNEQTRNAMGGTELMALALKANVSSKLYDQFQIISSRVRDIDEDKKTILWLHDLPQDPESAHLQDGGWEKFDKLVFVSHWQQQQYAIFLGVPYTAGIVLQNAIRAYDTQLAFIENDITDKEAEYTQKGDPDELIKIIYHTTPHRGLGLLVPVFNHIRQVAGDAGINVELDVYSSFNIYGWPERDEPFKDLFKLCEDSEGINYHGFQPNDVVRDAVQQAHIFAYPSMWPETSCIALMEAMCAGCMCVHPTFAALPETAANWTWMYPYDEDPNTHASKFANELYNAIIAVKEKKLNDRLHIQANYANGFYTWQTRTQQWNMFLEGLL